MKNIKTLICLFITFAAVGCSSNKSTLRVSAMKAVDTDGRSLVEFAVSGERTVPVRALDPVLIVGSQKLRKYRYDADTKKLVFLAHDTENLAPAKSVRFSWHGEKTDSKKTRQDGWQSQEIETAFDPKSL